MYIVLFYEFLVSVSADIGLYLFHKTLLLVAPVNLFLAGTRNLKIPDINITNNLPIGQARFGENKIINIGLCCDIHVDVYGWTGIGALYFFMPKRN